MQLFSFNNSNDSAGWMPIAGKGNRRTSMRLLLCLLTLFYALVFSAASAQDDPLELFGDESTPARTEQTPPPASQAQTPPAKNKPENSSSEKPSIPIDNQQPLMIDRKGLAVKIDDEPLSIDQVFEAWGPAWYEVMNAARGGKIATDQVDTRLQQEWEKALDTVVREAVFHLEAERYFEDMLQEQVQQQYSRQQAGPNDGSRPIGRDRMEAEMRRQRDAQLRASCEELINEKIRESGGAKGLKRILDSRSMTWEEWRQRQIRKAFTATYLHSKFRPVEGVEYRPADILNFYKSNPALFTEPGEVLFRHILFSYDKYGGSKQAYEAAWDVYDKISQGMLRFEDAAKTYSDDTISALRGGLENRRSSDDSREGWLSFVRDAAREEEPNNLGPILESTVGYHLVMLLKEGEGTKIPYSIAQKFIQQRMRAEEWDRKCDALYEDLKKQVRIEVRTPAFPPQLSWQAVSGGRENGVSVRRIGPASEDVR